ncbi:sulfite oxidase [Patulibacter sp.]|uniref:sulfite oxidase n=1 Tax=Patulibacter sp. TaxID=1912859 RepID=UPI002715C1A4|nr:sulfite oxidase [Patulibacter sp.]MDO9408975.1 sulfite oxidase [Patulibacter sp.]
MAPPHGKRTETIVHEQDPFNAETAPADLVASAITPTDAFYSRNHGAMPRVDAVAWALTIEGLVDRPLRLTLADLRDGRFPVRRETATLQCAGNRRRGLIEVREIPGEAPWGPGATGTAVWEGVALADVLDAARPADAASDVAFVGLDRSEEADPPQPFAGSIPLRKARRPEVLLAWGMNGAPLPVAHGAPVRVVVPGFVGARSVKWLDRIELRDRPWDGFFQDVVYRLLPPEAEPGPGAGIPLGEIALNAAILEPQDGREVRAGRTTVRGYAFAGGERTVARVDVSADGGETWVQADLGDDHGRWAWRIWSCPVDLPSGPAELVARAWDSAGASQPERAGPLWNPKGYVNNAWSRVRLDVGCAGAR